MKLEHTTDNGRMDGSVKSQRLKPISMPTERATVTQRSLFLSFLLAYVRENALNKNVKK